MDSTSAQIINQRPSLLDNITLHEDDLSEQAKHEFSYHGDILRAFELYRRDIVANHEMTSVGRHLALSLLLKLHTNCKQVLNYMAQNNELIRHPLPPTGPLVICGLPRTGSTLLYNLLACDPNCRAPLYTEMYVDPLPPICRSNLTEQERRLAISKLYARQKECLVGRPSIWSASHPTFDVEEDLHILQQVGIITPFIFMSPEGQFEAVDWTYDNTNKDCAYDYHKIFLCMLNSVDEPRSHWLLKAPVHAFFLDTFFRHYPQALMIMTHRSLDEVIPSFCQAAWACNNVYFDENNSTAQTTSIKRTLWHLNKMIERIVEFRTRHHQYYNQLDKNIFDVNYDDMMKQPIATVRRIYDHFNLQWSEEFEKAMNTWLHDNPQGKQGRHTYHLSDYGLTRDEINRDFADYNNLFLKTLSSNISNTDELSSTSKELESC